MKQKNGIRFLSLLLCCAMVLGCFPAVFAANEDGLCQHHPAHTEECGDGEDSLCSFDCEICAAKDENEVAEVESKDAVEEALAEETVMEEASAAAYPWEDMPDEEFAEWVFEEENQDEIIKMMSSKDKPSSHSFLIRVDIIEDVDLSFSVVSYLSTLVFEDSSTEINSVQASNAATLSLGWPIDNTVRRVTTLYFYNSLVLHGTHRHSMFSNLHYSQGMDLYGGSPNDKIIAAESGTVISLDSTNGGVIIQHADGSCSGYYHMSTTYVSLNQQVTKGDTIGVIGNKGPNSNGTHLHFQWSGGDPWASFFKDILPKSAYDSSVVAANRREATGNCEYGCEPGGSTQSRYFIEYYDGNVHEHNYSITGYENSHPHMEYTACACGDKRYTGNTSKVANCALCQNTNVEFTPDSRFNDFVPFTTYAVSTSNVSVFDSSLQQKGTINGSSTVITVNAVYTNGHCSVSYSGSSGECLIKSGDLIPNGSYFTVKTATSKQTSYRRSTGTDQIGSSSYVDKGDKCLVVGESNSRYQLIYPTSNSHKMGWVSTAVFDSVPDPSTPDPDPALTDVHFVREPSENGIFELYAAASNCQIIDWHVTCLTCGAEASGQLNAGGQSFVYACECGHERFRTSLIPGGNQNAAHYVTFGGESGVVTFPINHNPVGWLDDAIGGYNKITVRGWAFDTDALDSALLIRIYLDGKYAFTTQTGIHRPDIQIKYPQVGEYHGFETQFDATAYPGKHKIQVYAINEVYGSDTLIGERDIEVIVDTTPPQISNIRVLDVCKGGFTIQCTATDNIAVNRVMVGAWSTAGGQDDLDASWKTSEACKALRDGNTYYFHVNTADHNNDSGAYNFIVKAFDEAGNESANNSSTVTIPAFSTRENNAPVVEDVQIVNVDSDGFTIVCKVSDDTGICRVQIPAWSSPNNTEADKDDMAKVWEYNQSVTAQKNDDAYSIRISKADHGNSRGRYCFQIAAYDEFENRTVSKQYEAFIPTAELSEIQAYGVTSDGFILSCKAKPLFDSKIARVQYAVWSDKGGTDDLKGGWAVSEECAASRSGDDFFYYVTLADHKNDTGKYYYWIYCYDEQGNCTAYKDGEINVPAYSGSGVDNPVIQDIQVSEITSEGFTISCKVTDADGISHVAIPVWSSPNNTEADKNDLAYRWYWNPQCNAEKNGNTYTLRVNYADHGYQRGRYCYWISAYDSRNRNTIAKQYEAFIPTAELSEMQAYGFTSDGFILSCKAKSLSDSKIARVQYAVWSDKGGTDDLKGGWAASEECAASRSGDDFFYYVSLADHKNDTGKYYYWIYCYDEQGNCTAYKDGEIDVPAYSGGGVDDPLIQDIEVSEITSEGFTISCKVTDADGISHVAIPVWSSPNNTDADKDDLAYRWYWNPQCNAEKNGDTYTLRVNYADHGYQRGRYCFWISAYDSHNRNTIAKQYEAFIPTAELSEMQAYGFTSDGFILSCKAKPLSDSKIARVQYAVWSGKGGTDDLKGGWAASEECAAYRSGDDFFYYVSLADHKNDTGKYYYWIYCYDEQGNCTAYKDGEIDVPAYSGSGVDDPLIQDIQVSDITSEGFTISCKVTDADGISHVAIPVWSSPNNTDADKDDLAYRWYWNPQCNAEKNGDTYTLRVNYADHGYQRGRYCYWISAYDSRNRNTTMKDIAVVIPDFVLKLPGNLTVIGEEAFMGQGASIITIPSTVTEIGSRAFANCSGLTKLIFEGNPSSIADDILAGCRNVIIVTTKGSSVEAWATKNHLAVEYSPA